PSRTGGATLSPEADRPGDARGRHHFRRSARARSEIIVLARSCYAKQKDRKIDLADGKPPRVLETVQSLPRSGPIQKIQLRRRKSIPGGEKRPHPGTGDDPKLYRVLHSH